MRRGADSLRMEPMKASRSDCNPDVVISMQEHDVSVPDILQYCHALLSKVEIEAYMDNPGHWMLHCHIQEHAAWGMMAELHVTPKASAE